MKERIRSTGIGGRGGEERDLGVASGAIADDFVRPELPPSGAPLTASGLTGDELNDLNRQLAPVLARASEFEVLSSAYAESGEHGAAHTARGKAATCRSAVKEITSAWFKIRELRMVVDEIDHPPIEIVAEERSALGKERVETLDQLIAEIELGDADSRAALESLLPRTGDLSLHDRLMRIRLCPEWSNPGGILHDHPMTGCMALFRTLLVSPLVYMEMRGDLAKIGKFLRRAAAFREAIGTLEAELGANSKPSGGSTGGRLSLPGLSQDESDRFLTGLDAICSGDTKVRHYHKDADRVSTVRGIADHFRRYRELSRSDAVAMFNAAPWSTGIAALASAALNYQVTTEDVRGALKNWASD